MEEHIKIVGDLINSPQFKGIIQDDGTVKVLRAAGYDLFKSEHPILTIDDLVSLRHSVDTTIAYLRQIEQTKLHQSLNQALDNGDVRLGVKMVGDKVVSIDVLNANGETLQTYDQPREQV